MYNSFNVSQWRQKTTSNDYADSYAYYASLKEQGVTKTKSSEEIELEAFWDGFYKRQHVAGALSITYGALQGWGMAGFVLYLIKNVELGAEAEWAIAASIALTVATVNTWLVRPDLEKYLAFKQYERLIEEKNISKQAFACAVMSALLFGGIVAYGISGSLGTDDTKYVGPLFGAIAMVLSLAEGFLCIGAMDEILKTGLQNKINNLFNKYTDESEKRKAKMTFYGVIVASCIGMIGIALVGSKALANQVLGDTDATNISITSIILLAVSLAQLPFYIERAETLTRRLVPVPASAAPQSTGGSPTKDPKENKDEENKLIFNPNSVPQSIAQKYLWVGNAFFNAPAAYLGVMTILGKCMDLQKVYGRLDADGNRTKFENQSTFEQIFFQYGNSTEATIAYSVAALFFITAVIISLSTNSKQPTRMADPKGEHEMTRIRQRN